MDSHSSSHLSLVSSASKGLGLVVIYELLHERSARKVFRITIGFHANGHKVLIRNWALLLILNTRLQPVHIHDVLRAVG